ncbi:cupin domain-containing protein [Aliivibrio fischeri]|uniref:cupin domain-containing protein n=1 Tax=Aliivibrio fischeri TaxID=668 RepID=UPI001F26F154|nr:cupin domain-containing protein [Aliivibrio fischeri]MCE7579333.1 cupin domain-containing protein [Aliivibrio fischeri]MCE7591620.1 cupin domain-containing protein [Aliivibrio fischeri]
MYQLSFSLQEFLSEYWQKKPVIIKGGFENFQDPVTPEELAGLTLENDVDSRFISNANNEWKAEHGPLTEALYESLGETNWSIIVQAANHWHEGAAELFKPFKQMPNWLFDDIMISYSVPHGGVGPHIDQYDVFIIQGQGKRHWRVGDIGEYQEEHRHSALKQITGFEPIIDQILEPGDILYIPPGFPHDGYALEPSMSYSAGFRSPKEQELISNFADFIIENEKGDVHYHNPELSTQSHGSEITTRSFEDLKAMMLSAMSDEQTLKQFMGEYLSNSRHHLNIIPDSEKWATEELLNYLHSGQALIKVAGVRSFYHEVESCEENMTLFIDGESYVFPLKMKNAVITLCEANEVTLNNIEQLLLDPHSVANLLQLVNIGYFYAE